MRLPRFSANELFRTVRPRAALFDMDGVLADTEDAHLEAWRELLRRHTGAEAPEAEVRGTFGQTNDTIIPHLWRAVGHTPPGRSVAALSREKEALYREVAHGRIRPLPGLEAFLDWLGRRGIPCAVVTSGPAENVRFVLEEFGWQRRFAELVDRSRFAGGKPAPDSFLRAAELLGTRPARALVFEDSVHGLLAARRGGFPPCAVATTRSERELRPHARWVVRDFRDLAC